MPATRSFKAIDSDIRIAVHARDVAKQKIAALDHDMDHQRMQILDLEASVVKFTDQVEQLLVERFESSREVDA